MRVNTAAVTKRTLDMTPTPGALDDINVLVDLVAVTAIIPPTPGLAGGAEVRWGVFRFGDAFDIEADPESEHTTFLVDQSIRLDRQSDRTFVAEPGAPVRDKITEILNQQTIPAYVVDLPNNPGPPEPVGWPVGTSWLRIINDLSALVGGRDLYFDNAGTAQVGTVPDVDAPTLIYTSARPRIHLGSLSSSRAPIDAPNRFVIVDGSAAETPRIGVYDVPDIAPHSFAATGERVTRVKVVHGLCSDGFASECARVFAKAAIDAEIADEFFGQIEDYETSTFVGPLDPRHDIYNVVDVHDIIWRETGWTADLDGAGEMRHALSRSYDLTTGTVVP
jgi:hypothetical protein